LETLAKYADNGMDILVNKIYPIASFKEAYIEIPEVYWTKLYLRFRDKTPIHNT
jgi:hypothetical protein